MRRLILVACVLVAGCGAQRRAETAAGIERCKADIPAEVGYFMLRAQCVNDAITSTGNRSPAQQLINSARVALSEQLDARTLTVAEAQQKLAELTYRIERDQAERRAVDAAAFSQMLQATRPPLLQPYIPPAPSQPRPWSATCNRFGNMTTCSGN